MAPSFPLPEIQVATWLSPSWPSNHTSCDSSTFLIKKTNFPTDWLALFLPTVSTPSDEQTLPAGFSSSQRYFTTQLHDGRDFFCLPCPLCAFPVHIQDAQQTPVNAATSICKSPSCMWVQFTVFKKYFLVEISLTVQRFKTPNTGGLGSIPRQRTRSHVTQLWPGTGK